MLHERIYVFLITAHAPYAIVHAGGELDIAAVGEMDSAVRRAARRARQVVVDLRAVTFMDTFALHALVELQQEASTALAWSLHVVPGPGVQRLLDLAGWRDELRWISPEQLMD
jgi:stage II sporulation protein AA (anti-sigma F factor antagonist)